MGATDARDAGPQGRRLRATDVVGRIEASLAKGGFTVTRDSVAGRQAVIGRAARSRLGPRRPVFVLVAVFKAGMAGTEHLDRFLDEAGQYAATVKGGLAAGATAVAVAVVEAVGEGAAAWALSASDRPRPGCAVAFPVLVDVGAAAVTCPAEPADLHRLVRAHVDPSMRLV